MPNIRPELSHDDIQSVITSLEIPSCPKVVADTMHEAQKDDPDLGMISRYVTDDPGMAAAALRLANSPAFGHGKKLTSIKAAIQRLGLKNLVCVVVATALRNSFLGVSESWLNEFWNNAMSTASLAGAIAREHFGISPDSAFTYALFHDAAIPIMVRRFPNYMDLLDKRSDLSSLLIAREAESFPCDHSTVGFFLAKKWGLPDGVGVAIRFHHDTEAYGFSEEKISGSTLSLMAVTQVAEHLAAEYHNEVDIEVGAILFEKACAYLGMSEDDLDRIRHLIPML